ncbi:Alpha/beta hydrolase fold-1 [Trichoderma compactum]
MVSRSKPVVLLAHGSWHTPMHYQKFIDCMEAKGYKVVCPLLPSSQGRAAWGDNPAEADIITFREAAVKLVDEGNEVLAMGHSWGGVVITGALYGLGLEERRKNGLKGGIKCLVYLAAFVLAEGRWCDLDAPVERVKWFMYDGDRKIASPGYDVGKIMYSDLPVEVHQKLLDAQVDAPKQLSFYKLKDFAYREIDCVYFFCEHDAAFPYFAQKAMIEAFEQHGLKFRTETFQSGHFPCLSVPETLADTTEKYLLA